MWLVPACALLGAIVGWLLVRPAYRLSTPSRGATRTSCTACGWRMPDGLPGWLAVSRRCPSCPAALGPYPPLLAAVTALTCAGMAWRCGGTAVLPAYLLLALVGPLLAAVDLTCHRLPEPLTVPAGAATVLLFTAAAAATGAWGALGRAAAAAVALGVGYLLLAIGSGGRLGGGDAVLAGVLGFALGWVGWPAVFLGALLPWLVNAPFAVGALLVGRAGRRDELPFGPALLAGAYLTLVGPAMLATLLAH